MNSSLLRVVSFGGLLLALNACKPKAIDELSDSAAALKAVVAIETAQIATANKQIVLVVQNATQGPAVTLAEDLKAALQKQGLSVEIIPADLGDPMRYDSYGWKAADFLNALQKHSGAGAIVSLVGAPLLRAGDLGRIPATHPPVLIVAVRQIGLASGVPGNPGALEQMLNAKVIQLAVVEGSGTSSGKTDKAYKTFDQHYRILRAKP